MVAEADLVCQHSVYLPKTNTICEIEDAPSISSSLTPPISDGVRASGLVSVSSQPVSFSSDFFSLSCRQ